jgi:hypothetical protein
MLNLTCRATAPTIVLALLSVFVLPPAVAQSGPPEPLKLTLLPFFSTGDPMEAKSGAALKELVAETIETNINRDYSHISLELVDRQPLADLLERLPGTSGGRTVSILAPVRKDRGTDGVLAFWIASGSDKTFQLVSLFYLPERLGLESLTVSVNFERALLPVDANGNFEKAATKKLVTQLLTRNLERILERREPEPPVPDDVKPPDAEDTVPAHKPPDGDATLSEDKVRAPVIDAAPPNRPLRLGVLKFSHDFIQQEGDVQKEFSQWVLDFDLSDMTQKVLMIFKNQVAEVREIDGDAVSYDQIETPVLTLDPRADPRAKEKRLLQSIPADLNGVVFGHLHQSPGQGSQTQLDVHLRILTRWDLKITSEKVPWPVGPGEKKKQATKNLRKALENLTSEILPKPAKPPGTAPRAPGPPPYQDPGASSPPAEDVVIKIPKDANLFGFAKECYDAGSNARIVADLLADHNKIENTDIIKIGLSFKFPQTIDKFTLDKECRWIKMGSR